jgi:hypothetical protein
MRERRAASREVPHRSEMEQRFGQDFSSVKANTGESETMGAMGARAAAEGDHVAFAEESPSKALVAHELAHVVQARKSGGAAVQRKAIAPEDHPAEHEADRAAESVMRGESVRIGASPGGSVHLADKEPAAGAHGAGDKGGDHKADAASGGGHAPEKQGAEGAGGAKKDGEKKDGEHKPDEHGAAKAPGAGEGHHDEKANEKTKEIIKRFNLPPTTQPHVAEEFEKTVIMGDHLFALATGVNCTHENYFICNEKVSLPDQFKGGSEQVGIHRVMKPFLCAGIARFLGDDNGPSTSRDYAPLAEFLPAQLKEAVKRSASANLADKYKAAIRTDPAYKGANLNGLDGIITVDIITELGKMTTVEEEREYIKQWLSSGKKPPKGSADKLLEHPEKEEKPGGAPAAPKKEFVALGHESSWRNVEVNFMGGLVGYEAVLYKEGKAKIDADPKLMVKKLIPDSPPDQTAEDEAHAEKMATEKAKQRWADAWARWFLASYKDKDKGGAHGKGDTGIADVPSFETVILEGAEHK